MPKSIAALRKEDAAKGERCSCPCARCLLLYAEGVIGGQAGYCRFSKNQLLLMGYQVDDKNYNVCFYCLSKNEKCFKVRSGTSWRILGPTDVYSSLPSTANSSRTSRLPFRPSQPTTPPHGSLISRV